MTSACSGCRSAAYRNSEWIAASRAFRVRGLLFRSRSRWSRNAVIRDESRSLTSSALGALPVWLWMKTSSSLKVSR